MIRTNPFDDDKLKEECGVVGIYYGGEEATARAVLGLHALQHRGQEAAGIVSFDGRKFNAHRALGHVADNFSSEQVMAKLKGHAAIGHVRYSTTGETILRNVQPLFADLEFGGFALAHNGNLTNAATIHRDLVRRGSLFQSTTDTEVITHLMATQLRGGVVDRLIHALQQVEGAYSLVALAQDMVIGVRDPLGVRPLVLGKLGSGHILASETCALDIIGAELVRDVEPGELIVLDSSGVHSLRPFPSAPRRFCVFEYIYFARPDSIVEGTSVYEARKRIGAELSREAGVPADVVIPVPDFGRARGHRLCGRGGHSLRARHHPQPLCGPHLHRAVGPYPPSRREAEAQCQSGLHRGPARDPGGRQHRARHHEPEDRGDGAQRRGEGGAYAHLQPADRPFLLLWHRYARAQPAPRFQA